MEQTESSGKQEILDLLFEEEELTWQSILLDLVHSGDMDPWDINVTALAQGFISKLKNLKELDFRISGKMVLAAALLLRIKSNRLIEDDIAALDNILHQVDDPLEAVENLFDGMSWEVAEEAEVEQPRLIPRTPQPRQRKVSVYDLVDALEKALEVEERRKTFQKVPEMRAPEKGRDISVVIKEVYGKVEKHYKKKKKTTLSFTDLIPSEDKEDKVLTFIPLLHLENERKVDMDQPEEFGNIDINLPA